MIAIYLYCLVKSGRKPSTARVPAGLPGAGSPEAVDAAGGLWLVVAEVPLDTYGSERLEPRLSDLDWVGQIAMAHEQVVEAFVRRAGATVIPMKLFTMFSTRERAVADVAARRRSIDAVLRRIAGADEWGVRVTEGESAPARPVTGPVRSGSAFLVAKKQARDAARGARIAAAEASEAVFARLSRIARAARRRELEGGSGVRPPLLDAAFLVPRARRRQFTQAARREVAACATAGALMTISGPWPAYNFVQEDDSRP